MTQSVDENFGQRFTARFNRSFERLWQRYNALVQQVLEWPRATLLYAALGFALSLLLFPLLGLSFFPRTDAGQFVINFKAPSGTRLESTLEETSRIETIVKEGVPVRDLDMTVANAGLNSGFSALSSPNAAMHTGFLRSP